MTFFNNFESNSIPVNNWKGNLRSCKKWKIFKGRRVTPRVLLVKEKKGLFLGQDIFLQEKVMAFYHADGLFFLQGMERVHMTDYLSGS